MTVASIMAAHRAMAMNRHEAVSMTTIGSVFMATDRQGEAGMDNRFSACVLPSACGFVILFLMTSIASDAVISPVYPGYFDHQHPASLASVERWKRAMTDGIAAIETVMIPQEQTA